MGYRRRLLSARAALVVAAVGLFVPAVAQAVPIPGLTPGVDDLVGGVVGDVAGDVAGFGIRALTSWVADGAGWLVEQAFVALLETSDPTPEAAWFEASYRRLAVFGMLLAGPALVLGLLQALIRQDTRLMGRVIAALPVSVLLTGAAVAVTRMLLGATDEVSVWLVRSAGDDLGDFGPAFATGLLENSSVSGFVLFLVAVLAAIAALVLWIELLVRAALVYVLLAFVPVLAALVIWPAASGGLARLIRLLVAVVFSKVVMVAVVAMGVAAASAAGNEVGVEGLLVGTAMVAIATLAPAAVHRLLPLLEESAHARGNLSAGGAGRALLTAHYGLSAGRDLAGQLGQTRRGGAAGGMAGSPPGGPQQRGGGPGAPGGPGSGGPRPIPLAGRPA